MDSAFVFATLAPVVPEGVANGAVAIQNGVALRVVIDFDANHLSDIVAISTFAGAGSLISIVS